MPNRPRSGPLAPAALAIVLAVAGLGALPAQAGPSPVERASTGEEGPATITGTFSPFEVEGADAADEHAGHGTVALVETARGEAVLVRFDGPTAIEAGSTITISVDPAGGRGSTVRDVERLVAVRPPTAATSPRLASPEPGASSKAAPGGEGPAPLAASAPKTMLIIPVWCSHENGSTTVAPMPTAPTPTDFEQLVTTTVSPWFEQFSWRERSFVPTSTPWYDICPTWGPLPLSPEAVAAQHGYVSSAYDRVVMVLASPSPWLGAAEGVPGRRAIVFGSSLDPAVWAHELGHLDGMVHANSLRCLQGVVPVMYSLSATCTSDEYGDPASTMGDHVPFAGFSAVEADQLRWLPPSVITTVTTSTKVRIASYALPHTAFTSRAVKIPLPSGTYYVERRAAVGWDSGLASSPGLTSGVLVRVEAGAVDSSQFTATWQRHGNLLDATPATPTFADAALPMGQVFVTPEGVRIYAAPSGQLTTVYVDMPVGLVAPSNPQRVKAVVQANGTVQVGWDPPARNPGNLTYEIRTSDPNQAPITTTNLAAALPPLPDGTSAVGVRAYVTGNPGLTSQFAASLPRFTFPLPTTPAVSVVEGTGSGTVPHTVTLTLPWVPYGGATRNLGLYPGTADPSDWVPVGATVAFTGSTATYTFEVIPDAAQEGNETMDIVVADWRCAAGWLVPDCIVPTPIATVTIVDDD